ncbi:urease accessory protein UreF [Rhizobium sp. G187]|uniref:urease accessory protein UreF n=1 Tax=Rhizobium sp. G187 TaxID=3451352 RepID=UPI003EE69408
MPSSSQRQALLRLLAWLSPAFPIGAFSYSAGLESAVVEGHIADGNGLSAWMRLLLRDGGLRNDAILLIEAHRRQSAGGELTDLLEMASALAGSMERYQESTRLGEAFVKAASAWPHPVLQRLNGPVAYSVVVGAIAAAHGVDAGDTVSAFLHAQVQQAISVGIRLGLIGQTAGLELLAGLEGEVLDIALEMQSLGLDDLGSASIIAETLSMRHEAQYSRLFQS